jgi:hypothetical protein
VGGERQHRSARYSELSENLIRALLHRLDSNAQYESRAHAGIAEKCRISGAAATFTEAEARFRMPPSPFISSSGIVRKGLKHSALFTE